MRLTNRQSDLLAILSLLLAATLWGLFWYPLRWLDGQGLGGVLATGTIYAGALAVGAPVLWRRREFGRDPLGLSLMALAAGWCNLAFILAVIQGPVLRVLLLFYLSPVWAVLFGRWLLGERLRPLAYTVVAAGIAGALVMLWQPGSGISWPPARADWLALSSGMAFALSNVLIRRQQGVSVFYKTVVSWVGVLAVVVLWLVWHGLPSLAPVPGRAWLAALAIGAGGMLVMTSSVQYGVTRLPVHRSAVILLFELVAGALSSWLLAGERIRPAEWTGGGLILVAALLMAWRQLEEDRRRERRRPSCR